MTYTTHAGAWPSIQVNDLTTLPEARWQLALERRLAMIEGGVPLHAEDSTATGSKFTECSWGMCGHERAAWPDAEDHIWPQDFERSGRVAPLGAPEGALCPMDERAPDDPSIGLMGCFYSCRIFQRSAAKRPSRAEAVALYQLGINRSAGRGHLLRDRR